MSTVTCKVTAPHTVIIGEKRALPGEIHTVNLGQYLSINEKYPNALTAITSVEVVAPPPVEVESVEVTPHDNEPNPPSTPTRKRRAADSGNAQPSAS